MGPKKEGGWFTSFRCGIWATASWPTLQCLLSELSFTRLAVEMVSLQNGHSRQQTCPFSHSMKLIHGENLRCAYQYYWYCAGCRISRCHNDAWDHEDERRCLFCGFDLIRKLISEEKSFQCLDCGENEMCAEGDKFFRCHQCQEDYCNKCI